MASVTLLFKGHQYSPNQCHALVTGKIKQMIPNLFQGLGRQYPVGHPLTVSLRAMDRCTPTTAIHHEPEWSHIASPLKPEVWERALELHPDQEFARFICSGIRYGFRIGFSYHLCSCKPAKGNMQSVSQHQDVVERYLGEEREAGRIMGPFKQEAFPHVQVSPFGVIPKSEPGKWRLILDLSSPRGNSVNDGIDKERCSVSYTTVDEIAARVLENGGGTLLQASTSTSR